MSPAGIWSEKFKEISRNNIGMAYIDGIVALKYGGMDLHIGIIDINGPALKP
jgi:hypothetical protein